MANGNGNGTSLWKAVAMACIGALFTLNSVLQVWSIKELYAHERLAAHPSGMAMIGANTTGLQDFKAVVRSNLSEIKGDVKSIMKSVARLEGKQTAAGEPNPG